MTFAAIQFSGWGGFRDMFYQLEQFGVFDVLLPFILIFAILFGIMQKVSVFGSDSKKYNTIISLAISILVIVPHVTGIYPDSFDLVEIINNVLPQITLILIAIIFFLVLVGVFFPGANHPDWAKTAVPIGAALILMFVFGSAAYPQYRPAWLAWLGDPNLQMLVIILLIFGLIVWFVTGPESDQAKVYAEYMRAKKKAEQKAVTGSTD